MTCVITGVKEANESSLTIWLDTDAVNGKKQWARIVGAGLFLLCVAVPDDNPAGYNPDIIAISCEALNIFFSRHPSAPRLAHIRKRFYHTDDHSHLIQETRRGMSFSWKMPPYMDPSTKGKLRELSQHAHRLEGAFREMVICIIHSIKGYSGTGAPSFEIPWDTLYRARSILLSVLEGQTEQRPARATVPTQLRNTEVATRFTTASALNGRYSTNTGINSWHTSVDYGMNAVNVRGPAVPGSLTSPATRSTMPSSPVARHSAASMLPSKHSARQRTAIPPQLSPTDTHHVDAPTPAIVLRGADADHMIVGGDKLLRDIHDTYGAAMQTHPLATRAVAATFLRAMLKILDDAKAVSAGVDGTSLYVPDTWDVNDSVILDAEPIDDVFVHTGHDTGLGPRLQIPTSDSAQMASSDDVLLEQRSVTEHRSSITLGPSPQDFSTLDPIGNGIEPGPSYPLPMMPTFFTCGSNPEPEARKENNRLPLAGKHPRGERVVPHNSPPRKRRKIQ